MQVGGYNSLGRLGPWYERPEYRPPQGQETAPEAQAEARGDRRTLSVKNTDVPAKQAPIMPTGKVGLAGARELTASTAGLIQNLPPFSTGREPHAYLQASLMAPVYA